MRTPWLLGPVAALALVAGCGTGNTHQTSSVVPQSGSSLNAPASSAPAKATSVSDPQASGPSSCRTADLSLRLGDRGGAAGSTYAPIVFTNKGSAACTLFGYPGVSYVAPDNGQQVGAAASRNPMHASATVTLAPGASASALLQMTNPANYPASRCSAQSVGGLRVYPPGSKSAAYVAFDSAQTACSSDVEQLAVAAVVAGTTGQ